MDKNKLLIIVIVLLFCASAAMLVKIYKPELLNFSLTTTTDVSTQDIAIRDQINKIDSDIQNARARIQDQGTLDHIISSKQYLDLDDSVIRDVVVPSQYGRTNPFTPVDYSQQP